MFFYNYIRKLELTWTTFENIIDQDNTSECYFLEIIIDYYEKNMTLHMFVWISFDLSVGKN